MPCEQITEKHFKPFVLKEKTLPRHQCNVGVPVQHGAHERGTRAALALSPREQIASPFRAQIHITSERGRSQGLTARISLTFLQSAAPGKRWRISSSEPSAAQGLLA